MSKLHHRENDTVEVAAETEKSEVALREEAILSFWQEHNIFKQTLTKEAPKGEYIFYDGPPFATGLPHYGHILAGTIKDAIPRFWTMNGYHVPRKWGWDCHGLPLENLIEKKLGLATKRDIEAFGIQNFNQEARDSVLEYADDWAKIVPRMGRFVDMEDDYKTMDATYTESVWWITKELDRKGLLFEGFKSMHLCPRCGTTLSNFEVNQGYKDIKDIAVTVKLPLLDDAEQITDTSLLVWTTTPWTLPGNMAAAINKDFIYAKVKVQNEESKKEDFLILAKERLTQLGDIIYEVVEEIKGETLLGHSYLPPFPYLATQTFEKNNAWKIYHADYVELGSEGTGAVHIAPAYGEEDLQLAKENGVPIVHHVDADGHFMDFVTDFAGMLVKPKDDEKAEVSHLDADIEIVKALKVGGKLFKKENITHSYPHCWRCDTPLLNYATNSWFVDVPKIKDELVAENAKVKWVPEHVGRARFGNWLEGARDWAISRQRYWGAPLPIWKNEKTGQYQVIGSLSELKERTKKSGNRYFTMRHGESESNLKKVISVEKSAADSLTDLGRQQVKDALPDLPEKIDLIIHSGFFRTKETASIVATAHKEAEVIEDERISEIKVDKSFAGQTWDDYNGLFTTWEERYTKKLAGSENRRDVQVRMGAFLYDLEAKYQNKTILIVSHAGPIFALECAAEGLTPSQAHLHFADGSHYPRNAQVRPLDFTPLPHNDNYELDFHRPYIDRVEVIDETGENLKRVSDVFDCWFESGSMPYGQQHFLGFKKEGFDPQNGIGFPAQFIAEGLDQTRGWFYSLIVLGVALFGKSPYENVIVNGLVLAEDGKKMSKSLRNYPDPMELANRVGVDAMRLYLLSSPVIRAEDLNFSEKEVLELQRKTIGRLHNVLAMYEMYASGVDAHDQSKQVLDRWIIARLRQLVSDSTVGYRGYELDRATRPIVDFIDDLSVWYLRRSRERLKGDDQSDKEAALSTLRFVLLELAKVMAPVMPFYAEYLYRAVRADFEPESVHLTAWPEEKEVDPVVIGEMSIVREFVTLALEARTKAGLKVRQPLAKLSTNIELDLEYASIVADEVNVKAVQYEKEQEARVVLDMAVTKELKMEGDVREFMRAIQDMRKQAALVPHDVISLIVEAPLEAKECLEKFQETIMKTVNASSFEFAATEGSRVMMGEYSLMVRMERV